MTTLICSAHADDEVIGVGGTIAKLSKTEDVIIVIFFYGADIADRMLSWPPMMSEESLMRKRVMESERAAKFLGAKEVIFLGLRTRDKPKQLDESRKHLLMTLINKYKPEKIFYHAKKDAHPEHRFVTSTMENIISKLDKKPETYTYQVNLFDISNEEPKIIFDISKEFSRKMKALDFFKSQKISVVFLKPLILAKSLFFGKKHNIKFAEYFFVE